MWIFPAIDLIGGQAVRLKQGDYQEKTVYHKDPVAQAQAFAAAGARFLHTVDLDGAKSGRTENLDTVRRLVNESGLKVEIGGGIRTMETVTAYIRSGIWRVILGTAAVTDPAFLEAALDAYGDRIAVGVDVRDGQVMTRGWLSGSGVSCDELCGKLVRMGVKTVICTDISKDGMMEGTNVSLYEHLIQSFPQLDLVASGGVSSMSDVQRLRDEGLYGAIIGKALYTGAVDLKEAIRTAQEVDQ
ncbi:MAG: 1-(5-phosphoribosyl)-5-[Clostridia bacterium]|nr:1-(5-phosphoribosyl)-5-[(5-phosphoribosylamino)methylideneamino]imidazole-4-carboxamide isomerase [Clostridia bacterium]